MVEGILMLIGVLLILLLIRTRTKFIENKLGWRVKKSNNSLIQYSELDKSNNWRSISFEYKMYYKDVPRHALIIHKNWSAYPKWAQKRREEIILRLQKKLKEPVYTIIEKE